MTDQHNNKVSSKYLVFTDLDGTLLDHHDYNYTAALPAIERLESLSIPVILNSSKTFAEIKAIRQALHNVAPFVVENGAVIFFPAGLFPGYEEGINQVMLGRPLTEILPVIHNYRTKYRFNFQGFSDFSVQDVITHTGLSEEDASLAKQRLATEPVLWNDSDENLQKFTQLLMEHKLLVVKGGRFLHIMGQHDKAQAMIWLKEHYEKTCSSQRVSIALGDSKNDKIMLEQADYAAVIKKADGSYLQVERSGSALYQSQQVAPAGWREAIDALLIQINEV